MKEPDYPTIDFKFSAMTLKGLEQILQRLHLSGSVLVLNVQIDSCNLMELAAQLAHLGSMIGKRKDWDE